MPKSNYGGKSSARVIFQKMHEALPLPMVVDVGPGVGTYVSFRQPGQTWIGIEAWAPYIAMYALEKKYDQMIVADIRYFDWQTVAPVDAVIFGDILEHMAKEEALVVLDKALTAARVVLVSLPVAHAEQGELYGNPFEVHVEEDWTNEDALAAFPDWCVNIRESYIGVYFLSRDPMHREGLCLLGHQMDEFARANAPGPKGIAVQVNPAYDPAAKNRAS